MISGNSNSRSLLPFSRFAAADPKPQVHKPDLSYRLAFWFALFLQLVFSSVLPAQTVKVYVSSVAGDRIARKADLQFGGGVPAAAGVFTINDAVKYQKMDGFGASLMEGGIITLNTLPAEK